MNGPQSVPGFFDKGGPVFKETTEDTRTPLERSEQVKMTILSASEDIRFRIARAVRRLMGEARTGVDAFEYKNSPQAISSLAEALRSAASLLDNLHEIATSKVWFSRDVASIVTDIADMLSAARDIEALAVCPPSLITETVQRFDKAAQLVEKSKEVVDLAHELQDVELGVNNLGVSKDEFKRLVGQGAPKATKPPEDLVAVMREMGTKHDRRSTELAEDVLKRVGPDAHSGAKRWNEEAVQAGRAYDEAEVKGPFPDSPHGPVCESCGLDDPPRREDILPVVEKRDNNQMLCISCWQQFQEGNRPS